VNHLLLAAFDRFGQDTGRAVRVSIGWREERVQRLAREGRSAQAAESSASAPSSAPHR